MATYIVKHRYEQGYGKFQNYIKMFQIEINKENVLASPNLHGTNTNCIMILLNTFCNVYTLTNIFYTY